jgi:putative addiction module component (TIGR02574 family)
VTFRPAILYNAPAHLRRAYTLVISTPHSSPAVRCSGLLGGAASGYITGMTKATEAVLADALKLDAESRARLAAEILASLDGPADPDAEQAWQAEIARRVADLEDGKLKLESWAEVKRRIEKSSLGR